MESNLEGSSTKSLRSMVAGDSGGRLITEALPKIRSLKIIPSPSGSDSEQAMRPINTAKTGNFNLDKVDMGISLFLREGTSSGQFADCEITIF